MGFGMVKVVLFIEVSSFQGVLIRGVPAVLFIEVSSFQGVLISGVPAVLFIEVSSFQGVLIRGVLLSCLLKCPHFKGQIPQYCVTLTVHYVRHLFVCILLFGFITQF